jgi:hypothetical protein
MVLSELTNKELKSILRENDVRNYSKLNKKNLVKKVNQLIKAQNGGGKKSGKGKNKKYTLKELIGGNGTPVIGQNGNPIYPPPPRNAPGGPDDPKLKNKKLNEGANPQGATPQGATPKGATPQGANATSQGALPSASAPPLQNSQGVEQTPTNQKGNIKLSNEQQRILNNDPSIQAQRRINAARARGEILPPPSLAYRPDGSIDDSTQPQQAPNPYNPYPNPNQTPFVPTSYKKNGINNNPNNKPKDGCGACSIQ